MSHHYSNEMPPDFDETERANMARDAAQGFWDTEFKEFEITNIRHVLHAHDATEIKYIGRFLVGDGQHLMVAFLWDKENGTVTVSGAKGTDLDEPLEWF